MADAFVDQLLIPLALDAFRAAGAATAWESLRRAVSVGERGTPSALSVAFGGRSLARLVEIGRRWHAEHAKIDAAIVRGTDDRCWLPLVPPLKIGGIHIVPLASAADLADEGAAQDHCVGTFVRRCLTERCHILSLRDADGIRLSTARFELIGPPWEADLVEHQAAGNLPPRADAEAAAAALAEGISNRSIPVRWEEIEEALSARISDGFSHDDMAAMVGYDPNDGAGRNAALCAWSFALPKDQRGTTHDEWALRLGLTKMLDMVAAGAERTRIPAATMSPS
jgi:hypothetical protein